MSDRNIPTDAGEVNVNAKGRISFSKSRSKRSLFQPSASEVLDANAALQRDVTAWNSSVDAFLTGTIPKRQPVTMLKQTPLVLQMLNAQNLPISTTYGVLRKVLVDKHGLSDALVRQIPSAMADPVMVFRSMGTSVISDITMMLDLKDEHGATVVVPFALDVQESGYALHFVPSMYVKNNEKSKEAKNEWFVRQIESGNLLYENRQKKKS